MKFYFFRVICVVESGPEKGVRKMGKVRMWTNSSNAARRAIIGFVAHQSTPVIPANATKEEEEHIEKEWGRMRVLSIEPIPPEDLKVLRVPDNHAVYWWGWDTLPAPDQEATPEEAG